MDLVEDHLTRGFQDRYCGRCVSYSGIRGVLFSEYDQMLESMARNRYPEAERLKQIKGVGTLIALTYMLTLKDPHRFRKSRDAGCLGLQPGRRNSGQSEPQMHISKEGDPYLRALPVQAAHHVLGLWGVDSDLRRWA